MCENHLHNIALENIMKVLTYNPIYGFVKKGGDDMSINITAGALSLALLFSGGQAATAPNVFVNQAVAVATAASIETTAGSAIEEAKQYLKYMTFSRQGLIDQLASSHGSGFSEDEAISAVEQLEADGLVDWNAEALEAASSFIEQKAFSRQGLLNQLTSSYGSQFTLKEATAAVDYLEENELVDWNAEAVEAAKSFSDITNLTKQDLYNQLTSKQGAGFTKAQAEYALKELGY